MKSSQGSLTPHQALLLFEQNRGVVLSGLAPHDKLLLLLLLHLDPRGEGETLSWREMARLLKLSPSSCRRAAERLELLRLLRIHREVSRDQEPLPSVFTHLLWDRKNTWNTAPTHPLFLSENLDQFLEMRGGFEDAVQEHLEHLSPAKGSRLKKQGRASLHSPRPWRQTFGPMDQDGEALDAMSGYGSKERKPEKTRVHVKAITRYCLPLLFPQPSFEQVKSVTPRHCLALLRQPR